ncbi:MAG: CHAT domain-containing protein, partial [Acidimicrobiales bacterium]
ADPVDRAYAAALLANVDGDRAAQVEAVAAGFSELDRQQQLCSSAEMRVRLTHRGRALRDIAARTAIADRDPSALLESVELSRMRTGGYSAAPNSAETRRLLAELRDVRVALREAQLAGSPSDELSARARNLEQATIRSQRREAGSSVRPEAAAEVDLASLPSMLGDRTVVSYVVSDSQLWAVRSARDGFELVELGDLGAVERLARAQRTVLRRLSSAVGGNGADLDLLSTINEELDQLLMSGIRFGDDHAVTIAPAHQLSHISWSGLPSLIDREVSITPSLRVWLSGETGLTIETVGLLGGPDLDQAGDELRSLADVWAGTGPRISPEASVDEATDALRSCDLAHLAAHGTFRSDNPHFSSIEFADGPLTVFDLEDISPLPRMVFLASCDGAAASGSNRHDPVGTTAVLLRLGVSAVLAPTAIVDDGAARRFSVDFHHRLREGCSPERAVLAARSAALMRGRPEDLAAAQAFQLHGRRSSGGAVVLP